ncbi:PH domain-containing protein [uncultured Dokdonia sp.]|uniref:PH domain-containing protein n=1 Tax=uncultured Dokdonia sp. TaxID=575653 RepID=UPI00262455DB|nr:PH domain-containing protein [uncultured Dokdonia sp.]
MRRNIQSELRQHLDSNERLLWTGQPKKGILFRTADIFLIPFSVLWCGFAIFWMIMASQAGLFALFGIPFVIIGLIFVFGRFIIDAKQRENTFYGVTEDRIIIKSGVFSKSLKSLSIKNLSDIEYNEKNDGSGTISVGPKNPMMIWGNGMSWWPGMKSNTQLDSIFDVRKVYNQIIEIQNQKG